METVVETIKDFPELNEEPLTKEELEEQRRRLAGRPKGAKNKPKEPVEIVDDPEGEEYRDIFDVCRQYIKDKGNDTVRIMIYRGGDMLTEARMYMGGKKDTRFIYVNSWKELQDRFGGGRYHIKLISNNNGRVIKTQSQSLVDLTNEVSGAEDLVSPFASVPPYTASPSSPAPFASFNGDPLNKPFDNGVKSVDQSAIVMQQLLSMLHKSTQQKSVTQTLGEIIAVLTPVIPLIQSLLTKQKPMDAFEIQKMLDEKESAIRARVIEERDREEERIRRLVDEKVEYAGGGGEKSIVGELADLLKVVPDILKPVMPHRPQVQQQAQQKKLPPPVQEQPKVEPEIITPQEPLPADNNLTGAPQPKVDQEPFNALSEEEKYVFQTVVEAITTNADPKVTAKRIMSLKEKHLFLKVDGDKLVSVAKKMINLDDAAWAFTDEWVKTFYKVLKADATISHRRQKK